MAAVPPAALTPIGFCEGDESLHLARGPNFDDHGYNLSAQATAAFWINCLIRGGILPPDKPIRTKSPVDTLFESLSSVQAQ